MTQTISPRSPTRIIGTISGHKLALVAFLIPLLIRTIPEILLGPYQVGWDTIAFYVPNTIDLAGYGVGVWQMLGSEL